MNSTKLMTQKNIVREQTALNWILSVLLSLVALATYLLCNSGLTNISFFAVAIMAVIICLIAYRLIIVEEGWNWPVATVALIAVGAALVLIDYYAKYH